MSQGLTPLQKRILLFLQGEDLSQRHTRIAWHLGEKQRGVSVSLAALERRGLVARDLRTPSYFSDPPYLITDTGKEALDA